MKKQRSFTLVEILIAVIILGILVAVSLPSFLMTYNRTIAKDVWHNLLAIKSAQLNYLITNNHYYYNLPNTGVEEINTNLGLNITPRGGVNYVCCPPDGSGNSVCNVSRNGVGGFDMQLVLNAPLNPGNAPVYAGGRNPSCVGGVSGDLCPDRSMLHVSSFVCPAVVGTGTGSGSGSGTGAGAGTGAGSGTGAGTGGGIGFCTNNGDCTAGVQCCSASSCVNYSASNCGPLCDACPPLQDCIGGTCQLPPGVCNATSDCAAGQCCNANSCVNYSASNCGPLCDACPPLQDCIGGTCQLPPGVCNATSDCAAGQCCSANSCVNYSDSHCGLFCDACPSLQVCVNGTCQLPPGVCNNSSNCAAGQCCSASTCVPQDAAHCGASCTACPGGQNCVAGVCTVPPECVPVTSPCSGNRCCLSNTCVPNDDQHCGPNCNVCVGGNVCNAITGVCGPPPPCGFDNPCNAGECCSSGVCIPNTACPTGATADTSGCCFQGNCVRNPMCEANCPNLQSDGRCSIFCPCPPGRVCTGWSENAGWCSNSCAAGLCAQDGFCLPCVTGTGAGAGAGTGSGGTGSGGTGSGGTGSGGTGSGGTGSGGTGTGTGNTNNILDCAAQAGLWPPVCPGQGFNGVSCAIGWMCICINGSCEWIPPPLIDDDCIGCIPLPDPDPY